jgi:hypothetical protein
MRCNIGLSNFLVPYVFLTNCFRLHHPTSVQCAPCWLRDMLTVVPKRCKISCRVAGHRSGVFMGYRTSSEIFSKYVVYNSSPFCGFCCAIGTCCAVTLMSANDNYKHRPRKFACQHTAALVVCQFHHWCTLRPRARQSLL